MTPSLREAPDVTVVTGAAGWLGSALMEALTGERFAWARTGTIRPLVTNRAEAARLQALVARGRARRRRRHRRASLEPLFAGLSGTIDVIHAAGVIHPRRAADFARINADGTRHDARPRPQARRPSLRARLVEQPVRHQLAPERPLPQRGAVPPVLRLRPVEDGGRARGLRGRRGRTRRRDRSPTVVLRSVPAAAPDDVLPAGAHRPVPGDRRR